MARQQTLLATLCILSIALACAQDVPDVAVDSAGGDMVVASLSTDAAPVPEDPSQFDSTNSAGMVDNYGDYSSGQSAGTVASSAAGPTVPLSPGLAAKLAAAGDAAIPVLLSFAEHVPSASLRKLAPGCRADQAQSSPACAAAVAAAQQAAADLSSVRVNSVRQYLKKLGVKVKHSDILGSFAIANVVQAMLTADQVDDLRAAVAAGIVPKNNKVYLRLKAIEDPMEQMHTQGVSGLCTNTDGYTFDDPSLIRAATTADGFYNSSVNAAASGLRVAVIDQGVNKDHVMLQGRMGVWGDCSTTSSTCTGTTCGGNCCRRSAATNAPIDVCASYGTPGGASTSQAHGTACAASVAGNGNCGDLYRGSSNFVVDFFRAYYVVDFVNAFQAAVMSGAKVITTSLGVSSTLEAGSSTSLAADAAYDAGVIVFAAAGNFGCSPTYNGGCTNSWGYTTSGTCSAPIAGSTMSPANAHRVIAVGAYGAAVSTTTTALRDVQPMCYSARGPTTNGRIKPDIMGPTGIETAYTNTNNSVAYFSGTSAATPNAAGAFASFMSYRLGNKGAAGTVPNKGEFMASIIAAGENYGRPNNNVGAGAYRPGVLDVATVGNAGKNAWATATFTLTGQTAQIASMNVTSTNRAIKCAAWWPASAATMANNIDISLKSPSGAVVASSTLTNSVWEKVALTNVAMTGAYTLEIRATAIRSAQQVHAFCFY